MAVNPPVQDRLEEEIAGLDALDALWTEERPPRIPAVWSALWPKLMAVGVFLAVWQLIVWTHWKPETALPGPRAALGELWDSRRRVVFGTVSQPPCGVRSSDTAWRW